MPRDREGVLLVLCAPSGAGKSTLTAQLLKEFPRFAFSVSYTTRAPRGQEQDGTDYHFVDKATFADLRAKGFFAEWAEVHGNFYGTPLQATINALAAGKDLLFDIDVQGAKQLRASLSRGTYVFIFPPSLAELRRRLTGRGTDAAEAVEKRLANAVGEIRQAAFFDAWIVNDDLDTAYDELRAAYLAATLAPALAPGLPEALLGEGGR
ncbi:MAG: guanylate kinase [Desulfovibrionaceae bacterium]|jgi:guanylate kinase|nr:guanylate kinase [Desulfovibrionaceae bacterium]